MAPRYVLRPATMADLPLLTAWRNRPHVSAWWGDAALFDEAGLADPRVERFVASFGGRPFAYLQDYSVHGWENHHFADLPRGSRGIDLFIGAVDMLGRGHGTGLLRQWLARLFAAGAPVIAIDPHPANARAIATYAKLGFRTAGRPRDTDWGHILPMTLRLADFPDDQGTKSS